MKLIIAGGGTGGHLYPGIAVAEEVSRRGIDVLFMVSDRGIEKRILEPLGYRFIEQSVSAFKGVGLRGKLNALSQAKKAAERAARNIDIYDKILLMGGFAAAPVAFAAYFSGADVYIHEQNSVMGFVNKIFCTNAKRIFTSYPETKGAPGRSMLVGNPVRNDLRSGQIKDVWGKNILILGGSGGSRIINKTVAAAADRLIQKGFKIRHQTGEKLYEETRQEYDRYINPDVPSLKIDKYIDDMQVAYSDSDIIISRAGSGAVYEITYARRPAIYVPFAQATDNHQYHNADFAVKKGYAAMIEEPNLTAESLISTIEDMYKQAYHCNLFLNSVKVQDTVSLMLAEMGL